MALRQGQVRENRRVSRSQLGTHFEICSSMGQPSLNVFSDTRELLALIAIHVARNKKDTAAGFVSGCARDHDSDTDVRVPFADGREPSHGDSRCQMPSVVSCTDGEKQTSTIRIEAQERCKCGKSRSCCSS